MVRLFISHTHHAKIHVAAQKLALASFGIHAFVAHEDIEPSHEWQAVIEQALATCDALIAWLTPEFPQSQWCDQEVGFAMSRTIQIIPVRVGEDPYGFIGKYQGIQGAGKEPFTLTQEIVETLAKNQNTAPQMLAPAARAFAAASSYKIARNTYRILTLLPDDGWTAEALKVLEEAPAQNDRIGRGIYEHQELPSLIQEYVARRRGTAGTATTGSPTIECRAEVVPVDSDITVSGRIFRGNFDVWLYVTNAGPTAEFSARFRKVEGVPQSWGSPYGVRHVAWEGGLVTTRPDIDGYGGERRVRVAHIALDPAAFWFYTTENGSVEPGNQLLLSEFQPKFYGHNVMFDVEIVNQQTAEKRLLTATIFIPPTGGTPWINLRDAPA
jgi:hypothetical protein